VIAALSAARRHLLVWHQETLEPTTL